MNTIVWVILLITLIIVEIVTQQLVSIWFVLGATVSIILSLMGVSSDTQIIVFIAVSGISLILTRPFIKKLIKTNTVKTNADTVVEHTGIVVENIDNTKGTGRVKVDGLTWKAVSSQDNKTISCGEYVKILKIEGVKLIVQPKEQ